MPATLLKRELMADEPEPNPMTEERWSVLMAVAWVSSRQQKFVALMWPRWRSWDFQRGGLKHGYPSIAELRYLRRTDFEFYIEEETSVLDAENALTNALFVGEIAGRTSAGEEIPSMVWCSFQIETTIGQTRDRLVFEDMVFDCSEVSFPVDAILTRWPSRAISPDTGHAAPVVSNRSLQSQIIEIARTLNPAFPAAKRDISIQAELKKRGLSASSATIRAALRDTDLIKARPNRRKKPAG